MMRTDLKGLALNQLISFGLLSITWTLLLWLNFTIAPDFFAHFVAIPALFIASGVSTLLITTGKPNGKITR